MKILNAIAFAAVALASAANAQKMEGQAMDHQNMDHAAHMKMMAEARRQAEVSRLGKDVMPFALAATTHVFSKSDTGGTQQVVAKAAGDDVQIRLIRQHLHAIQAQFLKGNFSGPSHIHGQAMPGLAELKAARPGQIAIGYRDIKDGAELTYKTRDTKMVAALHKWFDAQLSDHGKDAAEGHMHHDGMKMQ
ncbi:MAG: aspartate carbamoyltransferase [Pseudomonadota bacterium]